MQTNRIYYVGMGPFSKTQKYGVFYDTRNGDTMRVGGYFDTFSEARNYMLKLRK